MELQRICSDDGFIRSLQSFVEEYQMFEFWEAVTPKSAEELKELKDLRKQCAQLGQRLENGGAEIQAIEHFVRESRNAESDSFVQDVIKHLKGLAELAELTENFLRPSRGRAREKYDFYLVSKVRDLFIHNGLKVNTYHQGPFCMTLRILLSACGRNVSEPRNQARQVQSFFKKYDAALKRAHQIIESFPQ